MKLKQTGSVFDNHGLWYYSVKLPGESRRRQVPLKAPGAKRTMKTDRPRKMAEDAAARWWEEHTHQIRRREGGGLTVAELCALWGDHCREYYKGERERASSSSVNAPIDVRMFRDLYGNASLQELTHADMLKLRDALVRSGVSRKTVNQRLWRVKYMISWALDEALVPATVKAELTQVKGLKRGRTPAPESKPVRPVTDAAIEAATAKMTPNMADMVKVHRYTGMRPCELCALRWSLIDTSRTPWVYRPPADANKNSWRGEFGHPRPILIGPKARAVLERHRTGDDVPFSPILSVTELLEARRAARATPFYGKAKEREEAAVRPPKALRGAWDRSDYGASVARACANAGIARWSPNQLRHTFATEVRRAYGLEACRAVLGHTAGGGVTDIYSFDALEEEMIKAASPAVEALG